MRKLLFLLMLLPLLVLGQTFCVRPGATGNGNGLDWNNAYTSMPATLVRGATYYIAAGTYSSYRFDDAVDGTKLISVIKANAANHGPDTGWQAAYAGQAVWNGSLDFDTSYVVFDGQTRNEADWFSGASYGFKITGSEQQIRMGHAGKSASHVQIRHTYLQASSAPLPSTKIRRYGLDIDTFGGTASPHGTGVVIHRCLFTGGNVPIFSHAQDNLTLEYSALDANQSNAANHGEAISAYYTNDRWIIRFNKFRKIQGTAVVAFTHATAGGNQDGFEIYGNVVWDCGVGNGVFGFGNKTGSGGFTTLYTNTKIYNNTIVDRVGGYNQGIAIESGSNNQVYNNLWVNIRGTAAGHTGDGDAFWNGGGASYSKNAYSWNRVESGAQTGVPTAIFVNYAGDDFRLASPTQAGVPLAAPYNLDLNGRSRGSDGVWDRGAFEFGGTNSPPVVITNVPPIVITNTPPVVTNPPPVIPPGYSVQGITATLTNTSSSNISINLKLDLKATP